jgi:hypothetical protein
VFPQFVVHADQAVTADDPHCNLVGEFFSVKVGVVREEPYMPQLVRDRRIELLRTQSREEAVFNGETERLTETRRCFYRDDERDLRLNRNVHAFRYTQLHSQSIDNKLNPIDDECSWFCWSSCRQTRDSQEDEPTRRRQDHPWE